MNTCHVYRFTAWDGHVDELGAIPRGHSPIEREEEDTSTAFAVSDDGNVVVGMSGSSPPTDAFIWTPETKIVKVTDHLRTKGVTGFDGWTLVNAVAVAPDGKSITGTGINSSVSPRDVFTIVEGRCVSPDRLVVAVRLGERYGFVALLSPETSRRRAQSTPVQQ